MKESDYKGYADSEDAAYRVQRQLTEDKNEAVGGYKVSLTSKQTQDMFDSDSPLYGAQVKSHFVKSPHNVAATDVMDPLAEVEMLFTAKEDLSASDSLEDLFNKTKVAPAVKFLIHGLATGSQAFPNTWSWPMQPLVATSSMVKKPTPTNFSRRQTTSLKSPANSSMMVRSSKMVKRQKFSATHWIHFNGSLKARRTRHAIKGWSARFKRYLPTPRITH